MYKMENDGKKFQFYFNDLRKSKVRYYRGQGFETRLSKGCTNLELALSSDKFPSVSI